MTKKSAADGAERPAGRSEGAAPEPALAIIGEPTLMKIVGAHKGGAKLGHQMLRAEQSFQRHGKGRQCSVMAGEYRKPLDRVGRSCGAKPTHASTHTIPRCSHRDPWAARR